MKWALADVRPLAAMYPEAFSQHPDAALLMPGDCCKVWLVPYDVDVLRHPTQYGERFWVHVVQRTDAGYIGQLNHALHLSALKSGDFIKFKYQHVLDVQESE